MVGNPRVGGDEIHHRSGDVLGGTVTAAGELRPVGEPESDGIRQGELVLAGMWNYYPMQFDDHAIFYICHRKDDGSPSPGSGRAGLVGPGPAGRRTRSVRTRSTPIAPETRVITRSLLKFPNSGIEIECTSLLPNFISVGTGYGIDAGLAPRHVPRSRDGDPGTGALGG